MLHTRYIKEEREGEAREESLYSSEQRREKEEEGGDEEGREGREGAVGKKVDKTDRTKARWRGERESETVKRERRKREGKIEPPMHDEPDLKAQIWN